MKKQVVVLFLFICFIVLNKSNEALSAQEGSQNIQQDNQADTAEDKWEQMTEEEKQTLREEINQRFLFGRLSIGRKEQLTVISAIEQQLVLLKSAVESMPESIATLQSMSEQERAEYREKLSKATLQRQLALTAIENQMDKLKSFNNQVRESAPRIGMDINQLREIRTLAVKENAVETVRRLDSLIEQYQQGRTSENEPQSETESIPPQPRPSR